MATLIEVSKASAIKNAEYHVKAVLDNMAELLDCPLSADDKNSLIELRRLFYHLTETQYQLDRRIGIKH